MDGSKCAQETINLDGGANLDTVQLPTKLAEQTVSALARILSTAIILSPWSAGQPVIQTNSHSETLRNRTGLYTGVDVET